MAWSLALDEAEDSFVEALSKIERLNSYLEPFSVDWVSVSLPEAPFL